MRYLRYITLLSMLLSSFLSMAQTATIRGFVYEKETGEPVMFTNVYLKGTTYGASTDVNGFYTITKVPAGSYTLLVTSLGYDSLAEKITLKKGDVISRQLYLVKAAYMLESFNVTAAKEEARTETRTSVTKITPKQLKQIPTIGGQADLAQYLQVLPGVIFTGDQGGQLYIRGGSPIQNKVLLDGMVVYNPFHSIGLFSVFDTDLMRSADVYTGGFNADFGGRISSVMDITTRDGNKKRLGGKLEANTFGAKLLLEGPISKATDENANATTFVLSVKNSYLSKSSKVFYKYVDENGLPFDYTDIYGKISFVGENGSKVSLFGFNFNDAVSNYKSLSDFSWNSFGGGANFVVIPGKAPVLLEGSVAYSRYETTLKESTGNDKTSSIGGFNAGLQFTYFLGKNEFKYGFDIQGFVTDYNYLTSLGSSISDKDNTTELAGFVKYKMNFNKFILEPGLRIQAYASAGAVSPEPRLSMKYLVSDRLRLKAAAGLYSQNLMSLSTDKQVVNLFYGFLSGPESAPANYNGEYASDVLQKAGHLVFGIEYDLMTGMTLNLEGYYKDFYQLTNLNRKKIFDSNYPNKPLEQTADFVYETGSAKGIDLSIKYEVGNLYLWGAYSLSWVDRDDGEVVYSPHYDRRHNINLVASLKMGPAEDWEVSARWNFGSGFPFTLNQGFFEKLPLDGEDPTSGNGSLAIFYDEINKGRLPTYHRLDLNLKKTFELSKYSNLELNAGVTNAYDRANVFYRERLTGERVDQLPIMWQLGASLTF